jgi:hypothetical protein
MIKKPQKRRPEIMRPGLKQLTPYEKRIAQQVNKADRDRWNELMAKPWNKWEPVK